MRQLALVAGVLAMAVFGPVGTVAAPTIVRAVECRPDPPARAGDTGRCPWDGGEAARGYLDTRACRAAADRYNDQDPHRGYECEHLSGENGWWVVGH